MTIRTKAQFASEWAALRMEEDKANEQCCAAKAKYEKIKLKREQVQNELYSSVGRNISRKLFQTDNGIVLVQYSNGQSHVYLEELE